MSLGSNKSQLRNYLQQFLEPKANINSTCININLSLFFLGYDKGYTYLIDNNSVIPKT